MAKSAVAIKGGKGTTKASPKANPNAKKPAGKPAAKSSNSDPTRNEVPSTASGKKVKFRAAPGEHPMTPLGKALASMVYPDLITFMMKLHKEVASRKSLDTWAVQWDRNRGEKAPFAVFVYTKDKGGDDGFEDLLLGYVSAA